MKDKLRPGLTRTASYQTTIDMRARQLKADVFSTPAMIGLMERTCTELTEPFLDDNEQTVGIHIDVRHLASTRIGQGVTMDAEIIEVKGRKIRYAVDAYNDAGAKIGTGTQWRAVVDIRRFACGTDQKVEQAS
ncbi:MAG TPA: thioesterase family protein [Candidatus Binatia bacterium]|nr:thioesterase family protein [Candidatus Binatia bacterium]